MTVTLNEEQTDRFSKVLYQNSNLAKAGDDAIERLPLDESKALHLEYPEAEGKFPFFVRAGKEQKT